MGIDIIRKTLLTRRPIKQKIAVFSTVSVMGLLALMLIRTLPTPAGAASSSSPSLTGIALFSRCYTHLTRLRAAPSHPLWNSVQSGQMDPIHACMQVLEGALLVDQGSEEGFLNNSTKLEALAILKTFNDLHRSWFPNDNLSLSLDENHQDENLIDSGQAALFITRALLAPRMPYSEVITSPEPFEALRSISSTSGPIEVNEISRNVSIINESGNQSIIPLFGPSRGRLVGIRRISANPNKYNEAIYQRSPPQYTLLHHSVGGGLIGTQSYMLLNYGAGVADGGIIQQRRWARAILNDVLCRDVPVVRLSDAIPYVNHRPTDVTPPFRQDATCMQCHSTIDQMASVGRNYARLTRTAGITDRLAVYLIGDIPITQPPETGLVDQDKNFARRPPHGRFYFRSFDGNLISESIDGTTPAESFQSLGKTISQTDDFYACASSRYLKYFTGIEANLQDIGDPDNPPLSDVELDYRNYVIALGRNLKQTQSLRELIREILSSDIYKKVVSTGGTHE